MSYESPGQRAAREREYIRAHKPTVPQEFLTRAQAAWKRINENLDRWNREHGRGQVGQEQYEQK